MTQLILFHQLKVEGFIVNRWLKEWPVCFKQMSQWIAEVQVLIVYILNIVFYINFASFVGKAQV